MKSIYDMMGRHTYPILREDAPLEHVERFFQVRALAPDLRGRTDRGGRGVLLLGQPCKPLPSVSPRPAMRRLNLHPLPGQDPSEQMKTSSPLPDPLNLISGQARACGFNGADTQGQCSGAFQEPSQLLQKNNARGLGLGVTLLCVQGDERD